MVELGVITINEWFYSGTIVGRNYSSEGDVDGGFSIFMEKRYQENSDYQYNLISASNSILSFLLFPIYTVVVVVVVVGLVVIIVVASQTAAEWL